MIVPPGGGRTIHLGEQLLRVISPGTPGHDVAVVDTLLPAGAGAPRHVHHDHEEAFLVLEGRVRLELDDAVVDAGPGTLALAERGQVHAFTNVGPGDARMLALYSPAASLGYLDELAALLAASPADRRAMQAFYARWSSAPA